MEKMYFIKELIENKKKMIDFYADKWIENKDF